MCGHTHRKIEVDNLKIREGKEYHERQNAGKRTSRDLPGEYHADHDKEQLGKPTDK